jgi:hypothetical protein
MDLGVY